MGLKKKTELGTECIRTRITDYNRQAFDSSESPWIT